MGGLGPSGGSNSGAVIALLLVAAIAFGVMVYLALHKGKIHFSGGQTGSTANVLGFDEKADSKVLNFKAQYPHAPAPAKAPHLRVFFIGNSYTLTNNLPELLTAIAATDKDHPVNIQTGAYAYGNATLDELWEEGSGRSMVSTRGLDYVVLQDEGLLPVTITGAGQMYKSMQKWHEDIRRGGAKTVVLETWARKTGSAWYTDKKKYGKLKLGSAMEMQDKIDTAANGIAYDMGAVIVPAGDYWAACSTMPGMPDLYNMDGSNPSLAGDYLVALLFYRALTGRHLGGVTYVPEGLSPENAATLVRCASYG